MTSTLFLARHGAAVAPHVWDGTDRDRPLTATGRTQAGMLAATLRREDLCHVAASPWVRCVETAEAVAELTGARVDVDERLGYGHPDLAAWVAEAVTADGRAVLAVSHGDLVPAFLRAAGALPRPVPLGTGGLFRVPVDDGGLGLATLVVGGGTTVAHRQTDDRTR